MTVTRSPGRRPLGSPASASLGVLRTSPGGDLERLLGRDLGARAMPDRANAGFPRQGAREVGEYFIRVGEMRPHVPQAEVAQLELYDADALLRSVVVVNRFRGRGCGRIIITKTLRRARNFGVRRVYLLTTTAMTFFRQLGFSEVKREDAPDAIAKSEEFSILCPVSASVMMRAVK